MGGTLTQSEKLRWPDVNHQRERGHLCFCASHCESRISHALVMLFEANTHYGPSWENPGLFVISALRSLSQSGDQKGDSSGFHHWMVLP